MSGTMAAISYGKRMLKISLERIDSVKRKKRSPEDEAKFYCQAGYDNDGFKVRYISDSRGYGVFSERRISKGDFLLEYVGERISMEEGQIREHKHPSNMMVYFTDNGEKKCIDASGETGHICQYVNTSDLTNSMMVMKRIENIPRLCLFACTDINPGDEITYNYEDKQDFWWRKKHDLLEDNFAFDSEDSDPFDIKSYVSESSESEIVESDVEAECLAQTSHEIVESDVEAECLALTSHEIVESDVEAECLAQTSHEIVESDVEAECLAQTSHEIVEPDVEADCLAHTSHEIVESDVEAECLAQTSHEIVEPDVEAECLAQTSHEDQNCYEETRNCAFIPPDEDSSMSSQIPVLYACKVQSPLYLPNEAKLSGTSRKPVRICPYCNTQIKGGKLKRHIFRKHKYEQDVQDILKKPKNVVNLFIDEKRREGIYNHNIKFDTNEDNMMRERAPKNKDHLRLCSQCKGFYSSRCFSKHKCQTTEKIPIKPLLLKEMSSSMNKDEEFDSLLNRFRDNEVGNLCRSDKIIKQVGYRHFNLRRHEKSTQDEVRKEVMNEMRTLARLFLTFQQVTTEQVTTECMFERKFLSELREAIDTLTRKEEVDGNNEKHGLKLLIDAVIQRAIKSLLGYYSETLQDNKYKELKMFKRGYSYKAPEMFSKARYQSRKNSLEKARHPKNITKEWELKKLRTFISCEITNTVSEFHINKYAWLRSLLISRLTLFNARRGEEPSRMLCKEFHDAISDVWLSPDMIENVQDNAEKFLVGQYKLAYLKGKGKKYVPVLIPNDLLPGLSIINEKRIEYGIKSENPYLFASKSSMSHASGWQALNNVCRAAGVDIPVTATKIRHWLSTYYASLDMSQQEQRIFLEHMGHDKQINKENYQAPPCVQHVSIMGKMLKKAESGESSSVNVGNVGPNKIQAYDTKYDSEEQDYMEEETEEISLDSSIDETITIKMDFEKKGVSVNWSKDDTSDLVHHFKHFITKEGSKNKGSLPTKIEILEYIARCRPQSLATLSRKEQYLKVRCKIFNERKKSRETIHKKIEKFSGKC